LPAQQAFDGHTLEAALARVAEEVGPNARIMQAEKVRSGGVAGFFARERFEVTVEISDDPEDSADGPVPGPQRAEPMSLLDLVEEVSRQDRASTGSPAAAGHRPGGVAEGETDADADAFRPSTEGKTFHEVLRGIASDAGLFSGAPIRVDDAPAHVDDEPAAGEPVPGSDAEPCVDATAGMLLAVGVPEHLVGASAGLPAASVAQRLLHVLEPIPSAPPVIARRGDVVVVVGEERVTIEAAGYLAGQLGQDADDVVLAGVDRHGFNTLSSPEDARRLRDLWRSCGVPFVVAVCSPEGAASGWARQMLEALEPVTVWAAVRADRKPDDVVAWAGHLGGVDALAVGACEETVSPAAVLSAGIPVAAVDGRRATPAAWTALLVERLVA
jgi:hypothetical protein